MTTSKLEVMKKSYQREVALAAHSFRRSVRHNGRQHRFAASRHEVAAEGLGHVSGGKDEPAVPQTICYALMDSFLSLREGSAVTIRYS
jgi:hypothetical protein